MKLTKFTATIMLVFASLFWAGNYVFGKFVISTLKPIQINFLRWLLAVIILFVLSQIIEKPDWKMIFKKWPILLILSLFGIIGYNILLYDALFFTTSLNAALINSVNPAMIAVFATLLLGENMSRVNVFGLLISLLGVLIILTQGKLMQLFSINYNVGDVFMLLVIISWTIYTLLEKKVSNLPPIGTSAVTVLFGVILMFPFFVASHLTWSFKPVTIYSILYLAIFPSVGSLVFWNSAVPIVGASKAGIFLNLITVFTAIISILLGNGISYSQIIGGVIVIIGVYLTNKKEHSRNIVYK
ncbi:DMT family transporter [Lactobacillus sp. UCMA15818]|uniref:DMT family transporter n=1 Tax=Lactobacillus sp. UCMA15818 TaxID=2583394 RepID=UPI0025AEE0DB|nr:DMT family transporter [Lactobacillus sp. UCMA15818]MDN2452211.1 DMT family transporter [Lactobacillus sp. UCMA15818]